MTTQRPLKPGSVSDKICSNTSRNDALEDPPEDVAVMKAFVAGPGERRMIWQFVLDAQAAEPAVGQVDLHLAAQCPFRANGKDIADDEHPDHEHWIDRGSADGE